MSAYGGTITVAGRNLIASLIAGGHTLELTRIMVGDGALPDGKEPINMEDLVSPLYEAASTVPTYEDGIIHMTVEYRNNFEGRELQQGFWLREFGIFAKTADTDEILLYYATLGDAPQPVNAYKENRIDIRRYPVCISVLVDESVPEIGYKLESYLTAEEAVALIGAKVSEAFGSVYTALVTDIMIPADGWRQESGDEDFPWQNDVAVAGVTAEHFPTVALDKPSLKTAIAVALCPSVEALDGVLRFWAENQPTEDMTGSVSLLTSSGTNGIELSEGGHGRYILPVASSTTLGGIKVRDGSGFRISGEFLELDAANDADIEAIYDDGPSNGAAEG